MSAPHCFIHTIAHAPVPANEAALTPVGELNGPYITTVAALAAIATIRLQAEVVEGPIDQDTLPLLLIGVVRPSHTHLFELFATLAAAAKIDAAFGTMIAIASPRNQMTNASGATRSAGDNVIKTLVKTEPAITVLRSMARSTGH